MHSSKMIFGGPDTDARGRADKPNQSTTENLTATTGRRCKGPRDTTGLLSFTVIVGAGSAPVGTITVHLSDLADPDPTVDAHWSRGVQMVPDLDPTGVTATVDLSATGTYQYTLTGVASEWVRFKITRTSGTLALAMWTRADGQD